MDRSAVEPAWKVAAADAVRTEDLEALLDGRIACVRVSGFLEPSWCARVARRFRAMPSPPARVLDRDGTRLRRAGVVLSEMLDDRQAYFAEAGGLGRAVRGLYEGGDDPCSKLGRGLHAAMGWRTVSLEEDGRPYLSDLVWELLPGARVPLHCDASPGWFQGAGRSLPLRIFDYPRLLNWNVYLDTPPQGGALRIYDRRRRAGDIVQMSGDTPSSRAVVAGARIVEIQPRAGDLVLFDVNNYHEVAAIEGAGRRIACHSQVGLNIAKKELAFWI